MPFAWSLDNVLNVLQPSNIALLKGERSDLVTLLNQPGSLVDVVREAGAALGTPLSNGELEYLRAMDKCTQESIRAAVAIAIDLGMKVYVTYTPGYVYKATITGWSEGTAVTIAVEGPNDYGELSRNIGPLL